LREGFHHPLSLARGKLDLTPSKLSYFIIFSALVKLQTGKSPYTVRACLRFGNMLNVPEFFSHVRQIFAGIPACMARKFNEAWRKKAGADSVLRDFKQALRADSHLQR